MPSYTKEQLAEMNADPSRFRLWLNGNTYWSNAEGFASHARAYQRPLVVTSNIPRRTELFGFELHVLAGIADKLCAALIESTATTAPTENARDGPTAADTVGGAHDESNETKAPHAKRQARGARHGRSGTEGQRSHSPRGRSSHLSRQETKVAVHEQPSDPPAVVEGQSRVSRIMHRNSPRIVLKIDGKRARMRPPRWVAASAVTRE